MARIMRFYGFQRIAASLLGGTLMWLAVKIFGSTPPEFWSEWPPKASLSLSNLVSGSLAVAFCGWVFLLLKPLLTKVDWVGHGCRLAMGITLFGGVGGLWQCLVGGFYLLTGENGCTAPVLSEWMRVVGWPLLIGFIPVLMLELYELAKVNPHLRRWLFSGKGHAATWIRTPELKGMSKPLSKSTTGAAGHMEEY